MKSSPIGANRVLSLLSKMFALAETWGMRPHGSNPCRGIDRYRERARDRLVSAEELARLGDALAAYRGYWAGPAAIRLMALTGMRKAEVLSLRWHDIDAERGWIRLPDSKIRGQDCSARCACAGACSPNCHGSRAILMSSPLIGSDGGAVIEPGETETAGITSRCKLLGPAVAKAAGIADLRLHDLRHGFASVGAMGGDSLFVLGKLLGHADSATTQRYAHLAADPLRAVADRISGRLLPR